MGTQETRPCPGQAHCPALASFSPAQLARLSITLTQSTRNWCLKYFKFLEDFLNLRVFSCTDAGLTIIDVTNCISFQLLVIDSELVTPRNTQKNIAKGGKPNQAKLAKVLLRHKSRHIPEKYPTVTSLWHRHVQISERLFPINNLIKNKYRKSIFFENPDMVL